eukprot:12736463-Heterocapsa_arctica.AAC.1
MRTARHVRMVWARSSGRLLQFARAVSLTSGCSSFRTNWHILRAGANSGTTRKEGPRSQGGTNRNADVSSSTP